MAMLVGINFMPRFAHTFSYFTFDNFFEACRTDLRENIYLYVIRFEDTWVRFSAVYIYIYTDGISGTYLICITRKRVRRVSRRRISKNETRIPATMRLNNSFGAKESTRFRCLSLDITVSIFFSFPLSLFSVFLSSFDLETGFCLDP